MGLVVASDRHIEYLAALLTFLWVDVHDREFVRRVDGPRGTAGGTHRNHTRAAHALIRGAGAFLIPALENRHFPTLDSSERRDGRRSGATPLWRPLRSPVPASVREQ